MTTKKAPHLTLDKMPTEIILHIYNFLDARYVVEVLNKVCQRFSDLINDSAVWKSRMLSKWSEKYLTLEDVEVDWKEACVEREESYKYWSNHLNVMNCQTLREKHLSTIDSFKILEDTTLLAAASRDRSFSIWNMDKLDNESEVLVHHQQDAHEGWIWCILGSKNKFLTGSWDMSIKTWDSETFTNLNTIKCNSPILSLAQDEWALFVGCYHHSILRFDLREPAGSKKKKYNFHKKSILGLAVINENQLCSISEDGSLSVVDWRAEKVLHFQKFDNYPSSLSYQNNQLWIGDKGGNAHLINSTTFASILTYPKIHQNLITEISNSKGCLKTSSKDGTICILQPTLKPKEIARIQHESKMEIPGFESYDNYLISSLKTGCDITIWSPNADN